MTVTLLLMVACLLGLLYVYGGYLWLLRLMQKLRGRASDTAPDSTVGDDWKDGEPPGVTVYFPAYNEEQSVRSRIENVFAQDYPEDRIELIVVSDGSTDRTAELVRHSIEEDFGQRLRLIESEYNRGPAAAQNVVAKAARHSVLVSTGAETEFLPGFLRRIVGPFRDPKVGVVGGEMVFRDMGTGISNAYRAYRNTEYKIRALEDALGVLVKTDGPCMAYRTCVWEELEEFEDVDQVVVLLARKKGYNATHVAEAQCIEVPNSTWRQELRARSRMTRKGLLSVSKRWRWRDIRRDPAFSFALYSHRYLRYFSPFLLAGFLASMVWAATMLEAAAYLILSVAVFTLLLAAGTIVRIPVIHRMGQWLASFTLANLGFASGVWGWLLGQKTGTYTPSRTYR